MMSTALALALRGKGHEVGLLDLDFTSPSTHVILGIEGLQPTEDKGIVPPMAHGLRFMSIVYYAADEPVPLRGADVSNAIIELMAITRWGILDYLIIDVPPGLGDATLDLVRLIRGIKFLVVTTPSIVAFETVKKLIALLLELHVPVLGVAENMVMKPAGVIQKKVKDIGMNYLGQLGYDPDLEASIGDVTGFKKTRFMMDVEKIAEEIERLTAS